MAADLSSVIATRQALEQALDNLQQVCTAQGKECIRKKLKQKAGEIKVDIVGKSANF